MVTHPNDPMAIREKRDHVLLPTADIEDKRRWPQKRSRATNLLRSLEDGWLVVVMQLFPAPKAVWGIDAIRLFCSQDMALSPKTQWQVSWNPGYRKKGRHCEIESVALRAKEREGPLRICSRFLSSIIKGRREGEGNAEGRSGRKFIARKREPEKSLPRWENCRLPVSRR